MKVSFKVFLDATFYHKATMEALEINEVIERILDFDSDEYKEMCREYEEKTGLKRGEDEESQRKFDEKHLEYLKEDSKVSLMAIAEKIGNVVKECYSRKDPVGYVEFGGYVMNLADFCAVRIGRMSSRIKTIER